MNYYALQGPSFFIVINQTDHDAITSNPSAWVTVNSLDVYGNPDGTPPYTVWVPFITVIQPFTILV